jgi:hypothetical protein
MKDLITSKCTVKVRTRVWLWESVALRECTGDNSTGHCLLEIGCKEENRSETRPWRIWGEERRGERDWGNCCREEGRFY